MRGQELLQVLMALRSEQITNGNFIIRNDCPNLTYHNGEFLYNVVIVNLTFLMLALLKNLLE